MKLRIRGNTLRLRLSQTEVHNLEKNAIVRDAIRFGSRPEQCLVYSLLLDGEKKVCAQYVDNEIRVIIPSSVARKWFEPEEVSIRATALLEDSKLDILIEKDFNCLKSRPEEDERDLFPHPRKNEVSC